MSFANPIRISSELAGFLGAPVDLGMSIAEAVQRVHAYVREKRLARKGGRLVEPDGKLRDLILSSPSPSPSSSPVAEKITYLNMLSMLKVHFPDFRTFRRGSKNDVAPPPQPQPQQQPQPQPQQQPQPPGPVAKRCPLPDDIGEGWIVVDGPFR